MKKQPKQHEGTPPLSNKCLNFIQNGKHYNWHLHRGSFSLEVNAETTVTCYHFCFIQKSLNGKADTVCTSGRAQIQLAPLSPCLACKLTLDGSPVMTESLWTRALHPVPTEFEALWLSRPQQKSDLRKTERYTEEL